MPGSEPAAQPTPESLEREEPAGEKSADAVQRDAVLPPATAMERKVINDAVACTRSLAELRGRNADWAEAAARLGVYLRF